MTKTDLNKQKTGVGTEKTQGTSSEKELAANLSETPLTVEQQVVQLRSEVKNLSLGFDQVLGLLKTIVKNQGDTGVMAENIAKVSKQIESITPNKNMLINDIFCGKDTGEKEKGGYPERIIISDIEENICEEGNGKYGMERIVYYHPKNFNNIQFHNIGDVRNFVIYCIYVVLAIRNRGIKIENSEKIDISNNHEVFCKIQSYSWKINEIRKIITTYYSGDALERDILEYILYLYKRYG